MSCYGVCMKCNYFKKYFLTGFRSLKAITALVLCAFQLCYGAAMPVGKQYAFAGEETKEEKKAATAEAWDGGKNKQQEQKEKEQKDQGALNKETKVASSSLCGIDEELPACFPAVIQSIIRAYALNPLEFAPGIYRSRSLLSEKSEGSPPIDALAVLPDGTMIIRAKPVCLDPCVVDYDYTIMVIDNQGNVIDDTRKQVVDAILYADGTVVEQRVNKVSVMRYDKGWKTISSLDVMHNGTSLFKGDSVDHRGVFGISLYNEESWEADILRVYDLQTCSQLMEHPYHRRKEYALLLDRLIEMSKQVLNHTRGYWDCKVVDFQGKQRGDVTIAYIGEERIRDLIECSDGIVCNVVNKGLYIRDSHLIPRSVLVSHAAVRGYSSSCSPVRAEGKLILVNAGKAIDIFDIDGAMRAFLHNDDYYPVVKLCAQNQGIIVTSGGSVYGQGMRIHQADSRLTELLGQLSFAQLREFKALLQHLAEMYGMVYQSLEFIDNRVMSEAVCLDAISNIQLTLFGKDAATYKLLPRAIQENIMRTMRCKIQI